MFFQLVHKGAYQDVEAKRQETLDASVARFHEIKGTTTKLPASNSLQKSFTRYVTEMVALDGLPLSVTNGVGFKRLVEFLKPELTPPSPRTVSRKLEALATKVALPHLNTELSNAPSNSLHFIVDIWSSRVRQSVMGIRVQYVKNWKLQLYTVSFRHIEGRHTGQNIRETFVAEMRSRGVREPQVGTVVCDNAANMTKAFNMTEHFGEEWLDRVPDGEGSESEHSFQEPPEPVGEEITSIASFHRVRCAAHTLQLAVNAALRKDEGAKEILALINATVNVFRRSCYWTERLKVLCGKDLIPLPEQGGLLWLRHSSA